MIFNLTSGGASSGGLNFTVVGGTSAPSSPADNTIWVNTSTSITGWAMQGSAPTGSEGLVWIKTALSGNTAFNALKKNAIQIAVVGCQQYVSGSWANVAAQIWQNSAWVEFSSENLVLFEAGAGDSGKWTGSGWTFWSNTCASGTIADSALKVSAPNNSYQAIGTASKVDLTNYSKIYVDATYTQNNGGVIYLVVTSADAEKNVANGVTGSVYTDARVTGAITLDVSSMTGEHYIAFSAAGGSTSGWDGTLTVTKVYLE